ncbi:MAG: hypothetical protein JST54_10215 [Deltaproteobacteria bacterium]|nr:hypothetical protein [Deltaproteobacteria bacterium]
MIATLVLLAALAAEPDAGPFADSELGQKRAGENVTALDERWLDGFAKEPLLARVERKGDELAVAFYGRGKQVPDAGAPVFEERARFNVPMARQLEHVELRPLGSAGEVLAVTASADDPDEQPVVLTIVGHGPKQLLQASFLRDGADGAPVLALGGPEGFSFASDGGGDVFELSRVKRVKVTRPDGGEGLVELGGTEKRWTLSGDKLVPGKEGYRDFLPPLALKAPGHRALVDGKPTTSEKLPVDQAVVAKLPANAQVRLIRLAPGCLESEARAKKEPAATRVELQLDDGGPIDVAPGQPIVDPRLFGAGEFTFGPSYGSSELLVFDPPVAATSLSVKVRAAANDADAGCVSEVAAY